MKNYPYVLRFNPGPLLLSFTLEFNRTKQRPFYKQFSLRISIVLDKQEDSHFFSCLWDVKCIKEYISLYIWASEWENRVGDACRGCIPLAMVRCGWVAVLLFSCLFTTFSVWWTWKGVYLIILLFTLLFRSIWWIWQPQEPQIAHTPPHLGQVHKPHKPSNKAASCASSNDDYDDTPTVYSENNDQCSLWHEMQSESLPH